jgi:hypothetical protein
MFEFLNLPKENFFAELLLYEAFALMQVTGA